ncbi:MAG: ribulose-phosphate 3-epimerase [Chloroflexota bacterium]|nr:ribulose-phosphate 3-epimerase [Chloroflexota bacterium]MDE2919811.1 ribulose-phosphate 3-epimerase [Chloroflexota bacterium]
MSQVLIAPSILSADFASLGDQVREAEVGGADWIHVDVMDGHFVPQISFGEPIVRALRPVTKLPLDVHLMIEPVDPHLKTFAAAGADSITIHVEAAPDPARTLQAIRDLGVRPGLTLRPGTPVWALWPYLELADVVLVMTVEPGRGGQAFMPNMLPRIEQVAERLNALDGQRCLQVDGGLSSATIGPVVKAGAQVIVAGSAVFGESDGVATAIDRLRRAALG